VQVDPIKPTVKPPGTKNLKLLHDGPPSKFAFKFNLRRYTKEIASNGPVSSYAGDIFEAGAYTRPLSSST